MAEAEYADVERYVDVVSFSKREQLAIEFAERFALAHTEMDAELFDRMRVHFSDTEVVELNVLVGYCLGMGRIYTVLDIANECPVIH